MRLLILSLILVISSAQADEFQKKLAVYANGKMPKAIKDPLVKEAKALKKNHNFAAILKENAKWPESILKDMRGAPISSKKLVAGSTVVFNFFRGHW